MARPDIFFFNMVDFLVGMENAQRVLLAAAVVAQHQKKLVIAALGAPQNRGNGVVRCAGLGQKPNGFVRITAPDAQYLVCTVD